MLNNKKDRMKKSSAKKYFITISVICLVILFIALILWWNPLRWFNTFLIAETKDEQKVLPKKEVGDTTIVYGVEMQNKCFTKYQDFIKNYGAEYSKCLMDVDFNEEYCVGFDPDTQGLSDVNIVVILDASGSMAEKIGSEAKIDIAKKAVSNFLTKTPKGVKTGLVVYGQKGSNSMIDKDLSCNGIEEVVKLGGNNSDNIIAAMNSFDPKGWTPISGSLDFAKNIFKTKGVSNKNYLILVSDGIESCDGDPLTAAENLKMEIKGIKLNVIGFTTDSKTRDLLTKIALRGDGSYLTVSNSSGIAKAFNDQLLLIKKDCLKMTVFKSFSINNNNNFNNLNCWLAAYEKEVDDFTVNILNKPGNAECSLEISNALLARHTEFWYKKQDLEEKNNAIYKKIESDLNDQLKVLEKSKN